MDDRYADWDAAYVLGSLSTDERREYEEHLDGCARCRDAMASLASIPSMLSRVDPVEAIALLESDAPVRMADFTHRRLSRRGLVGALVAAAVVLLAVLIPLGIADRSAPPTSRIALAHVTPSPLSASVVLTRTSWGTRVDMTCTYAATYGGVDQTYQLYVVDRHGQASLVSSWHAGPGDTARTSGSSALSPTEIAAVQIRSSSGAVLLRRAI